MEHEVDVVCFDLDDTLVVERPAADAAMLETCRMAEAQAGIDAAALAGSAHIRARARPARDAGGVHADGRRQPEARDVQGALGCRMRAVWLDASGAPNGSGPLPCTRISRLDELPAALGCAPRQGSVTR